MAETTGTVTLTKAAAGNELSRRTKNKKFKRTGNGSYKAPAAKVVKSTGKVLVTLEQAIFASQQWRTTLNAAVGKAPKAPKGSTPKGTKAVKDTTSMTTTAVEQQKADEYTTRQQIALDFGYVDSKEFTRTGTHKLVRPETFDSKGYRAAVIAAGLDPR